MKAKFIKLPKLFGSTRALFAAAFTPPKSEYGLEEFATVVTVVARTGLIAGGITSMGYTYVVSYSIARAILSEIPAQIASIVAMAVFFLFFDILLSVTYTVWLKLQAEGRIRWKNRKDEGGPTLFFAGLILMALWIGPTIATLSTSMHGSEYPVALAMASELKEEKKGSTKSESTAKQVLEFSKSFNDQIKEAKKEDNRMLKVLQKDGDKAVKKAIRNNNKYFYKDNKKFTRRVKRARADSAATINDYMARSEYKKAMRAKELAINKFQKSIESANRLDERLDKSMSEIFDNKAKISIYYLRVFGGAGTILFLLGTGVLTILTTALSNSNSSKVKKKMDKWVSTGTVGNQQTKDSGTNPRTKSGTGSGTNTPPIRTEWNTGTSGTDSLHETYKLSFTNKEMTLSELNSEASRQANKYAVAKKGGGGVPENAEAKYRECIAVIGTIDQEKAIALARKCLIKYGINL